MTTRGRPTNYSDDFADEFCRRILCRSVSHVCKDADMPEKTTVYVWLARYPFFADKYARAKITRAQRRADDVDDLMEEIRGGSIDPQQGRVMLDAIKWQTAKESPKVYGKPLPDDDGADDTPAEPVTFTRATKPDA